MKTLFSDSNVVGVVLSGEKSFVAGADIKQMRKDAPPVDSVFVNFFNVLENAPKPVVACITNFALGGGLEVAMTCSHRVTHKNARLGLPEVQLGLIPGWGGTQRLPRLVGLAKSLEMILKGEPVSGSEAAEIGLVNCVVSEPDDVLANAIALARGSRPATSVLMRKLSDTDVEMSQMILGEAERRSASIVGVIHPKCAIDAIRACVANNTTPLAGLEEERRLIRLCAAHPAHPALRHVFLSRRESAKVPNLSSSSGRFWKQVGIVGAGKMGSG